MALGLLGPESCFILGGIGGLSKFGVLFWRSIEKDYVYHSGIHVICI